jgi:hypothetical protein
MSNKRGPDGETGQPMIYQIRIKGHLGRQWADQFEELSITLEEDGTTLLTGPVVDQAALHGILRMIRDLGAPLLSVYSDRDAPEESVEV